MTTRCYGGVNQWGRGCDFKGLTRIGSSAGPRVAWEKFNRLGKETPRVRRGNSWEILTYSCRFKSFRTESEREGRTAPFPTSVPVPASLRAQLRREARRDAGLQPLRSRKTETLCPTEPARLYKQQHPWRLWHDPGDKWNVAYPTPIRNAEKLLPRYCYTAGGTLGDARKQFEHFCFFFKPRVNRGVLWDFTLDILYSAWSY